jgi:excisionase family DNA binding protein
MPDTKNLLTISEAADYLGLKVSTLRAWTLRRRIPYVKLGLRAVRIRLSDLEALVEAGTVPARPCSRTA